MQTRFILLNTSHAGNVGAVARAMKTMGFDDLVLVDPRWKNVLRREETIQRASGALDVLDKCRIVDTLDEALEGMTHLCATAMTPRDFGPPTSTPREHLSALAKGFPGDRPNEAATTATTTITTKIATGDAPLPADSVIQHTGVAFLFGSERFGMRNEDVYRCHVCFQIPSNPKFGSLNIAAAVQLIAYEWRLAQGGFTSELSVSDADSGPATPSADKLADAAQVLGLLQHWEQALVHLEFLDPSAPKKLMPRLNALFNRANVRQEEIHILRGIAKSILQCTARSDEFQPGSHGDRKQKTMSGTGDHEPADNRGRDRV